MPTLAASTPSEDHVQAALVEWLRLMVPHAIVSSVPLGGLRTKREAAKLKWAGALAGIPDLFVALPGGRMLWIEVKAAKGVLSPEQKAIHAALASIGHHVVVARGIPDVRDALAAMNIRTREAA